MVRRVVFFDPSALGGGTDAAPDQPEELSLMDLLGGKVVERDGRAAVHVLVLALGGAVDDLDLGVGWGGVGVG